MANTRRMNRLEELGRVDAERAHTAKGARNLRDEKRRIVGELKGGGIAKRGKGIAYGHGGQVGSYVKSMGKAKRGGGSAIK
jgi:hypothetical protein